MQLLLLVVGGWLLWQHGAGAPHIMSPTAVFIALLGALLVDASSFGSGRLPDKIALVLATMAIREGLDGSPLDRATTQRIHDWIASGLTEGPLAGSRLAEADVNVVIGFVIGLLWIYAMICLLPNKLLAKYIGRAASMQLPASKQWRLNPTVWALAFVLGIGADMPAGVVGAACRGSVDMLTGPAMLALGFLFGA